MDLSLIPDSSDKKKDQVASELDALEKANKLEHSKTEMRKSQFINEIKGGLGQEIKANPNKIKIIKKTWKQKVKIFFTKIFTKF
jgi:hypothetical protein